MQSWKEFVELSLRGDMHAVHVYISDFRPTDASDDSFYAKIMAEKRDVEEPAVLFGKCDGKTLSKRKLKYLKVERM